MIRTNQIRSMKAITWLLVLSIIGTWLLSMGVLTLVTAQEMYDALYAESRDFSEYVNMFGRLDRYYEKDSYLYGMQDERFDEIEHNMLTAINANMEHSFSTNRYYSSNDKYEDGRNKLIRDINFTMETAVLFYDGEGKLLHSSDEEIMYFRYYTEEEWKAGDSTAGRHYGWINLSDEPQEGSYDLFRSTEYGKVQMTIEYPVIRVTGTLEGNEVKPAAFYYIRDGESTWNTLFDNSGENAGEELVTIYLNDVGIMDVKMSSLRYDGTNYESLTELTKTLEIPCRDNKSEFLREAGRYELNELILFSVNSFGDYEKEETDFVVVTAIRSNPLACAVKSLFIIYLVTGMAAIGLLLFARTKIRKHFAEPIENASKVMEDGWNMLYLPNGTSDMWMEAAKVSVEIRNEIDYRRMKENETTRLQTALDYAKSAEKNRRQMTSAIAHELKTPLAIIHGYAEGLKEHIAENKRDEYVDVILSETERIDGMVLEMLDLSRLEAGKIKLSRDEFALKDLTESIFAKLAMAAQAKNIQILFKISDSGVVIADENRIGQVIENFATNAIKYTNPGGNVVVQIQKERNKTAFYIENECAPLSELALSKVWETFYRTDESRQGSGTGLGLAIAKNIVELHGGTCFVRNTKNGVEFGFRI